MFSPVIVYNFHSPDLPQMLFMQLERVTAEGLPFSAFVSQLYLSLTVQPGENGITSLCFYESLKVDTPYGYCEQ